MGLLKKPKIKLINQIIKVVYKLSCNDCDKCYVGQTSRRLEIRKGEHQDNIKYKDQFHNVVSKHILDSEVPHERHSMNWEGIEILYKEKNWKKRLMAEMIYIKKQGSKAFNKMTNLNGFPRNYEIIYRKI